MPLAQFVDKVNNIRLTAVIPRPKHQHRPLAWLSMVRKYIKELPHIQGTAWFIEVHDVTSDWIRFDLRNSATQTRVYLVIVLKKQPGEL